MKKSYSVYGERNSGTNFLVKLINTNLIIDPKHHGKKHSLVKEYNESDDHLNFCIVRNLNDWLHSTYKNPYHIWNRHTWIKNEWISVYDFSNQKIKNNPDDLCPYDINLGGKFNLVEVRYLKYNSYKNITNKILVNLDFLQHSNENKEQFLNFVSEEYNLKTKTFNSVEEYKGGQGERFFRTKEFYKFKYPQIDFSKLKDYNKEIEEEINNLTFQ